MKDLDKGRCVDGWLGGSVRMLGEGGFVALRCQMEDGDFVQISLTPQQAERVGEELFAEASAARMSQAKGPSEEGPDSEGGGG